MFLCTTNIDVFCYHSLLIAKNPHIIFYCVNIIVVNLKVILIFNYKLSCELYWKFFIALCLCLSPSPASFYSSVPAWMDPSPLAVYFRNGPERRPFSLFCMPVQPFLLARLLVPCHLCPLNLKFLFFRCQPFQDLL